MPALFSRRRAASNPPLTSEASSTAALAASQAFLKSRNSNASLSSAAAAAALRSHATSPIPVSNVQTKRMARRASVASNTSVGSARPLQARNQGTLERQPSSGSMADRTFRSPSPKRSSPLPIDRDAPPVPAIPSNVAARAHKRSSSLEPPIRPLSPDPKAGGGRGVSVDRAASRVTPRAARGSNLSQVPEVEREPSRNSVNYSRPMSPKLTPPDSPVTVGHSGWHTSPIVSNQKPKPDSTVRPTSPPAISPVEAYSIQQSIQAAAEKPVPKKKKAASREGSHLVAGGLQAKPTGTAVRERPQTPLPEETPPERKQRASTSTYTSPSPVPHYEPHASVEADDVSSSGNTTLKHQQSTPENGGYSPVSLGVSDAYSAQPHRSQSLSPARSAHFSPVSVDLTNGIKHQPPPRSVSPAKSALKHSPSTSTRNRSPIGTPAGRGGSLDSSDNTLDEAPKARKKKSVRVSLDEGATAVYPSAAVDSPSAPVTRGIGSSKWSTGSASISDDDLEGVLKPRPALPSFGSVRGRKHQDADEEVPQKVTETVSSSMSNSISTAGSPLEASSDHAIGGLISQDWAAKQSGKPQDPVPPVVTSVEGTGDAGSDSSSYSVDEASLDSEAQAIPHIAVLPATPRLEDQYEEQHELTVPGSFSDQDKGQEPDKAPSSQPAPSPAQIAHRTEAPGDTDDESSSSDSESIYSDAAEDWSEIEDEGGFASLDAIVESPVVAPVTPAAVNASPQSAVGGSRLRQSRFAEPTAAADADISPQKLDGDWSEATAYWSGLSGQRREQLERDAKQEPSTGVAVVPVVKVPKPKQSASSAVGTRPNTTKPTTTRRNQPQPAPEPRAMRQSMRGSTQQPVGEVHMRTSMRSGESMRTSMRSPPPSQQGLAASKHSAANASRQEPRGALQKRNIPPAAAAAAAGRQRPQSMPAVSPAANARAMANLGPTAVDGDDSDASESSFKRRRRSSNTGGKYNMPRTMRAGMVVPSRPASSVRPTSPTLGRGSSKFSIRSLSPTGSLMGRTLRGPQSDVPTLRGSPKSNAKFGGFGKKPKAAKRKPYKSRFSDSSDEEDEAPRGRRFQSRFADSDDEDDVVVPLPAPSGLTPVRGIPRRTDEEDRESTDLEEEQSETEQFPPVPAPNDVTAATNGGAILAQGSLRDSKHDPQSAGVKKEKKRGLFGLGKKKTDRPSTPPPPGTASAAPSATQSPSTAASPRHTKLQRRPTGSRMNSDSWPLPSDTAYPARPATADGVPASVTERPPFSHRYSAASTTLTAPTVAEPSATMMQGRPGKKKKKFPMLRRVFGLDD